MRFAQVTSLAIFALVMGAHAQNKVNPHNQILWPTCNAGQAYVPSSNTCADINTGGGLPLGWTTSGSGSSQVVTAPGKTAANITASCIQNGAYIAGSSCYPTIQSAVAASTGSVRIPAGTYNLTADIVVPSNMTITCDSWGAIIKQPGLPGVHHMFNLTGVSNVTIRGCQMDGTGMTAPGQNSMEILVMNSSHVDISGNYLHDCPTDCIRLGDTNTGINNAGTVTINGNQFYNAGTIGPSGSFVGATSASSVAVTGNVGSTALFSAVDIEPSTAGTPATGALGNDVVVSGNSFSNGSGACIMGLQLDGTGTGSRLAITGNTCSFWVGSDAIRITNWQKFAVTGNIVEASLSCIHIQTSNYGTVTGNVLTNCSTAGIYLDGSSNIPVTGNAVYGSSTMGQEGNSAGYNSWLNNRSIGNTNYYSGMSATSVSDYLNPAGGSYQITAPSPTLGYAVGNSGSQNLRLLPSSSALAWNSLVQAGDQAIIYDNSGNDTGNFVLGPRSSGSKGFRISADGVTHFTPGVQVTGSVVAGTGMQHKRTPTCTTAASLNAVCTTTVTWTAAFPDTSYTAACAVENPNAAVSLQDQLKSTGTMTVVLTNLTATALSSGTVNCIAMHD